MEQNQQLLEQDPTEIFIKADACKGIFTFGACYIGDGIYDMIVRTIFW